MPVLEPKPMWEGEEVFIIGGGTSLRGFDWTLLHKEKAIGCNNAFRLGPEVCDVCLFVDKRFIFDGAEPRKGFYDELARFPNLVVTNDSRLGKRSEPWLFQMPRKVRGLHRDALGYNASCGATAINLALLFGAKTVYLLGIDMHLDKKGRPNWHNHLIIKPNPDIYSRMLRSFLYVKNDLNRKFPNCRVFNVTDGSSLNCFPKIASAEFWEQRRNKNVQEQAKKAC
jgi:hypothetical protein